MRIRYASTVLCSLLLWSTVGIGVAPASGAVTFAEWQPAVGDRLLVDTEHNMGYLIHEDGQYVQFRVVTGQRRRVWYIGRSYFAATPEEDWVVRSTQIKGDRITFGPTGRFLRMFRDGEQRTPYGIHGHRSAISMLEGDMRYRSMGCIIVAESVLNLIEQTYLLNGEQLQVTTRREISPSTTV